MPSIKEISIAIIVPVILGLIFLGVIKMAATASYPDDARSYLRLIESDTSTKGTFEKAKSVEGFQEWVERKKIECLVRKGKSWELKDKTFFCY